MPITPFHFGPGAMLHVLAPRQVSFIGFCMANVLIDIEPLYYMLTDQFPIHRWLHTYLGVALGIAATVALFMAARCFAKRFWLPNLFSWRDLTLQPVVLGAVAGGYSHVLLDSVMHSDMRPWAPFSNANPMWQVVSLGVLHWFCLGAGMVALGVVGLRWLLGERPGPGNRGNRAPR